MWHFGYFSQEPPQANLQNCNAAGCNYICNYIEKTKKPAKSQLFYYKYFYFFKSENREIKPAVFNQ